MLVAVTVQVSIIINYISAYLTWVIFGNKIAIWLLIWSRTNILM